MSYLLRNFNKTTMMHTKSLKTGIIILAMAVAATGCRKKPDPIVTPEATTGEFGVEISNYAGDSLLVLDTKQYQTGTGDKFTVSKFNYYISNVKFKKSDGTYFSEPESYHLVYADANGGRHFHIEDVPAGGYTAITFLIGVDSARNTAGAQTGALDPAKAMFWDWNQGYIMAKLEGKSPNSGASDSTLRYHIGGFSGANSALRTVTLTFPFTVTLKGGAESTIPIKADVMKWFTPNTINMATTHTIMMPSATSKKIADNYANMFSLLPIPIE